MTVLTSKLGIKLTWTSYVYLPGLKFKEFLVLGENGRIDQK